PLTGPLKQIRSATVVPEAAAVERIWPGRQARVEALHGGITNHNYRVEVDGGVFVLRMGGAKTELLGIDRAVEHAASLRAEEIGVGPEVAAFVEAEGWLVTRFIDGKPVSLDAMKEPDNLRRAAEALRKLHGAAAIPGRFDAHSVDEVYREEAEGKGVHIPPEFYRARDISERIREARGPQALVPCHNDLLNANFLDDGRIRIVDWEYAGMGDRFFDLANFSVNHEFGVGDDWRFLAFYFEAEREANLAGLRLMRFMSDFREAMWGVLQSGISTLDFDFTGYAAKHFSRMLTTAADPMFEGYLKSVREA
ncbi:MAG TPA: phosphotransferase, partial [Patescibacteria group bacterium]|nr:phosphotransferase [Patescibacteria group bacterium]